MAELTGLGLMQAAGLAAFERRREDRTATYSYEQAPAALGDDYLRQFSADVVAWAFFQDQAPWYQRAAIWWVVGAKKEETRRRLATLIDDSTHCRRLAQLTRPGS